MRSLFNLIVEYSDANGMMPIIAIASIIFVIFLYVLFKAKWVKYLSTLIITLVGILVFLVGISEILEPAGLNLISLGAKIMVFGIVGLLFSCIMGIFDEFARMFGFGRKKQADKDLDDEYQDEDDYTEYEEDFLVIDESDDETKIIQTNDPEMKKEVDDETKVINLKADK